MDKRVIRKFYRYLAAGLLGLIALMLFGCDNTQNKPVDNANKTLVIGNGAGQIPTLDPGKWSDNTSLRVIHDLFEGLVFETQQNKIIPGLAVTWAVSEDKKTYVFYLRKDAKWSNGKPVTAYDFEYAFKRNVDPKTGGQQVDVFRPIVNGNEIIAGKLPSSALGVKALNADTLEIKLAYPYPFFLESLLNPVTYPLYKPAIEKYGDAWTQVGKMISNGPYMLKEWVPNGHILVKENPYYWDKKAIHIKQVKYLPMSSQTEYSQFLAGQVDMTYTVPSGFSKVQFEKRFGSEFINVPMLGTYFYWFNMKKPGVNNVAVRQALTMVVDRNAIVQSILKLGQTPLYGQVPNDLQGGIYKGLYLKLPSYQWVKWPMNRRIDYAKSLLTKAGFSAEHPLILTISFNTQESHKMVAEAIAQMWIRAFGDLVKVTLNNQEWKVYLQDLQNGNYDIGRMGGIATINEASNFLESYLCGNVSNYGQFCNDKLDKFYYQGMASLTKKAYDENMEKALLVAMKAYVTLPIYDYTYSRFVSNRVGGYDPQKNYMDSVYSKWFYFK
ncbi:peptide ABC transporter substrate-binding protein [Facilibium subflavum]|uniref:peptide ABC transporter substrate-binding protein n=1 Tax=Facilibium subflavum TaxID=2219058 RepID=UPI001F3CC6A1|nr:peptide ABC transporter substrate-binding protein [Facilibium subflavum]